MTDEELKNKCTERAKIFQQAMESCHSSSPIDCIEWFADRIAELEAQIQIDAEQIRALQKQNGEMTDELTKKSDTNHQLVEQLAKLNERCSELEITVGTLRTFSNEQAACIERFAKENANLKDVIEGYKKIAKWCDNCDKIAELQKEIRCECTRCVYSDSPCIRSDYGVENDEDVCPNYENVFTAYTQLKKEWQEQVQKATGEGYARTLQTMQLTKAKEYIKLLLMNCVGVYESTGKTVAEIQAEAEQFIKESEVGENVR